MTNNQSNLVQRLTDAQNAATGYSAILAGCINALVQNGSPETGAKLSPMWEDAKKHVSELAAMRASADDAIAND